MGEESPRLTQLEWKLLRYFVENEGRIIPRRELLENVWGVPGNLNTAPRTSSSVASARHWNPIRHGPATF